MTTRTERDCARIRCLTAMMNSLHCELARIVRAGEDPDALDSYVIENLKRGLVGDSFVGLSRRDLMELMGSIAALEKLIDLKLPPEQVRDALVIANRAIGSEMRADLFLYLEGIVADRAAEVAPEEAQA